MRGKSAVGKEERESRQWVRVGEGGERVPETKMGKFPKIVTFKTSTMNSNSTLVNHNFLIQTLI